MRADVAIPIVEAVERCLQPPCSFYRQVVERLLQGPEEAFDAPVHPGTPEVDALMAYAQAAKGRAEHERGEYAFIVGTNSARFAKVADRQAQVSQQGPRRFVGQHAQRHYVARAVIDRAEDHMQLAA